MARPRWRPSALAPGAGCRARQSWFAPAPGAAAPPPTRPRSRGCRRPAGRPARARSSAARRRVAWAGSRPGARRTRRAGRRGDAHRRRARGRARGPGRAGTSRGRGTPATDRVAGEAAQPHPAEMDVADLVGVDLVERRGGRVVAARARGAPRSRRRSRGSRSRTSGPSRTRTRAASCRSVELVPEVAGDRVIAERERRARRAAACRARGGAARRRGSRPGRGETRSARRGYASSAHANSSIAWSSWLASAWRMRARCAGIAHAGDAAAPRPCGGAPPSSPGGRRGASIRIGAPSSAITERARRRRELAVERLGHRAGSAQSRAQTSPQVSRSGRAAGRGSSAAKAALPPAERGVWRRAWPSFAKRLDDIKKRPV